MNDCIFSPCRRFRYVLKHRMETLFEERPIIWIGLNPSTADEQALDPTLRRIRNFSEAWGFNAFYMLNLFAFRATDPKKMKAEADPVGPENDEHMARLVKQLRCPVVACWGSHGGFRSRCREVYSNLRGVGVRFRCVGYTKDGFPSHPLYIPGDTKHLCWPETDEG